MSSENDTDARLRDLEIKITFLEDHVGQQDRAMHGQNLRIAQLQREIQALREMSPPGKPDEMPPNEKPPHW